jgi:hypothetical protein
VLEQARPFDARGKAVGASTVDSHANEERSKRRSGGGDRHPAPPLCAPHRKEGIHLSETDFSDGVTLLAEPIQEGLNVPAAVVDRARRQAALQAHVVRELVDEISVGARLLLCGLQSVQEAKPVSRDLYKTLPAELWIADPVMTSLMTNPAVGRCFDLSRGDDSRATDVDPPSHKQKFAGQPQQRIRGSAYLSMVSQEAISLFG